MYKSTMFERFIGKLMIFVSGLMVGAFLASMAIYSIMSTQGWTLGQWIDSLFR